MLTDALAHLLSRLACRLALRLRGVVVLVVVIRVVEVEHDAQVLGLLRSEELYVVVTSDGAS